jgi:hypothetical protein
VLAPASKGVATFWIRFLHRRGLDSRLSYILIVIANALYLLLGFLERQYEAVA